MGVVSQDPGYEGKLPHRLAVCVTKLDDPRVFKTAHDLGMLIPDDSSRFVTFVSSIRAYGGGDEPERQP